MKLSHFLTFIIGVLVFTLTSCSSSSTSSEEEMEPGHLVLPKSIPNYLQNFSLLFPELVIELATYTKQTGQDLALYDIEVHRLSYPISNVNGKSATASALLLIPKRDEETELPLSIVSRATIFSNEEAPTARMDAFLVSLFGSLEAIENDKANEAFENASSKLNIAGSLFTIEGAIDAYRGFVTIVPDYLGYGSSSIDISAQPYLISEYYVTAATEALKKARTVLDSLNVPLNNKIFLRGYSEGGYATLAIQEALETAGEPIIASAPSGGPYYLPLTVQSQIQKDTLDLPAVIPKIFTAYRQYESLTLDPALLYTTKVANLGLDVLISQKELNGREISERMGSITDSILAPETIVRIRKDSLQGSPLQNLFEKLGENTVATAKGNYQLTAATRLYTCDEDPLIDPKNADSLGAVQNIPVIKLVGADHSNCRAYSAPLIWFDSIMNE
jgi:pimeloyl-ACP methyl ester carboxylesterase